MSIVWGAQVS